jgi:putative hydrolase of HD superfamily
VSDRLAQILTFLERADALKAVERRTRVGPRQENSAEHSWHIALHDLVEIGAGDTYAFDDAARVEQAERERAAAQELFALLPDDLAARLHELWEEFEAGKTPEAKLAVAVDRLQALAQNLASEGSVWHENAIRLEQVRQRNAETLAGDPALAALVETLLERAAPYLI